MKNKKHLLMIIPLCIVCLGLFIQHFYLSVNGDIFANDLARETITTIRIVKTYETSDKIDTVQETILNDEQQKQLLSLLQDTSFKKTISKSIPIRDKERYMITGEDQDNRVLFRLKSYSGQFIIVDAMDGISPPKHYWGLKIQNPQWQATLEKILSLPTAG